jgi:photosystem II stability/assembly factor-like uncharacterized protein
MFAAPSQGADDTRLTRRQPGREPTTGGGEMSVLRDRARSRRAVLLLVAALVLVFGASRLAAVGPTPAASTAATDPQLQTTTPSLTVIPSPTGSPAVLPSASNGFGPAIDTMVDATVENAALTQALDTVAFADLDTGWAAGSGVILGTTDGGRHWRDQWSGALSVSSLVTVDPRHAWALGRPGLDGLVPTADQLVRTTDGGRTWQTSPLTGGFREIAFSNRLQGWAVVGGITDTTTNSGRLEVTDDGGLHWHASALKRGVDSVCFADARMGWAASGAAVYRTIDAGRHWAKVETGPNDALNSGWQTTVRCRGSAAWALWTGGAAAGSEAYRVARTLDGGTHWKTVLSQLDDALGSLPTIDAYAGSFAPTSPTGATFLGLCTACGYGSWSSTRTGDGGRTVHRTPIGGLDGASLNDVTFPDAKHGWIAGSAAGGFLLASEDGGRTWHRAYPSPAIRPALDVDIVTPTIGFGLGVVGDSRTVLRTDDGGADWRAVGRLSADALTPDRDPVVSFVDPEHGWAATADGLLSTTDGGRTWDAVPNAPDGGVAFADVRHGCAGTFQTPAKMTIDGGETWVPVAAAAGLVACAAGLVDPTWAEPSRLFDPGNLLVVQAIVDTDHAWAVGSLDLDHFGVAATADGGRTWTGYRWSVPPDGVGGFGPDTLVRSTVVSPTMGWVFTRFGRLYETTDGGVSWREISIR